MVYPRTETSTRRALEGKDSSQMNRTKKLSLFALAILSIAAGRPNTGGLQGTVTDAETGQAVQGADVLIRGTTFGTVTDVQGRYSFPDLPAGNYTLAVYRMGYSATETTVTVADGQSSTVDLTLIPTAVAIEGVTVTAGSRRPQKITEAPATINVIGSRQISEHPAPNVWELLARQKGVDYIRPGVAHMEFNVRGFNSAFNTRNLRMDDGRLSTMIAAGVPFGPVATVVRDDIERIEIVLGPSAALFGPNAHHGLSHTITKDPRASEETLLVMGAGSQDVLNTRFRHARVLGERASYKVVAEYFRGTELRYIDSVYVNDVAFEEFGLDRDFEFLRGEASLFFETSEDSDLIFSYGGSRSDCVLPVNTGRNQLEDWVIQFGQIRFASPRLFAQVYHTWSDTDASFSLNQRTKNYVSFLEAGFEETEARRRSFEEMWSPAAGVPLPRMAIYEDASRRLNAEVQYNNTWAGVGVTAGGQYQRDMADSRGTFLLDQGGGIDLWQLGAYGQVEVPLGGAGWKLLLAGRADDHELYGFNLVPKAGILRESERGTWRLTYGKGIGAPAITHLSMNVFGGLLLGNGEGFTLSDGSVIDPLKVEEIQTVEVGFKGILRDRWFLDSSVYFSRSKDFISPPINIAPTASSGGPLVARRGDRPIEELQPGFPVPGAFVLTNVNFGSVATYGFDVGVHYYFSAEWNLTANYSFFGLRLDENDPGNDGNKDGRVTETDLPINTPTHKGGLSLNTNQGQWFGSVFGRWVTEYDFFSGNHVAAATNRNLSFNGSPVVAGARVGQDFNEGPLGGFITFDLSAGFHLSPTVSVAGQISNLFDAQVRDFAGSPPIGRLLSTEVKIRMR
jgi:iron complex outermembrane receptor protein